MNLDSRIYQKQIRKVIAAVSTIGESRVTMFNNSDSEKFEIGLMFGLADVNAELVNRGRMSMGQLFQLTMRHLDFKDDQCRLVAGLVDQFTEDNAAGVSSFAPGKGIEIIGKEFADPTKGSEKLSDEDSLI
jgi:hypothetical protein